MKGLILFPSLVILSSLMIAISSVACAPTTPSFRNTNNLPQTMAPGVKDMMVAPNHSKIRARVLTIDRSPQFSDKWNLKVKLLMIQPIQGSTFAEVGQTVQAFTISEQLSFKQNDVISAEAEYLGDPSGGSFRLTQVQVEQQL